MLASFSLQQTATTTREPVAEESLAESEPLVNIDLKVPYLNQVWSDPSFGLSISKPVQLYADVSGRYRITLSKLSESIAVLRVQFTDEDG